MENASNDGLPKHFTRLLGKISVPKENGKGETLGTFIYA
jgi:hypothetical protein